LDAETGGQKSALETADAHRDRKSGDDTGEIPAETAFLESPTKCAVWEDWMVVCAVRYEPVSLLFGQYQGDFRKKQRADYEKSQKCPQSCGFSLSGQIREQGETGSIDRHKQGDEFADSGFKKPKFFLLPGVRYQCRFSRSERTSAQLTPWSQFAE
jgi:hypothetical protein